VGQYLLEREREVAMIREFIEGVTFAEFRGLAARIGWTTEELAERFKGKFGGPAEGDFYERPLIYLQRVLAHDSTTEGIVIPYRCLIDAYVNATRLTPADPASVVKRRCACGCGSAAWGRNRYAARPCQERGLQSKPVSDIAVEVTVDLDEHHLAPKTPPKLARQASEHSLDVNNSLRPKPTSCPETPDVYDASCEECGQRFLASLTGRPRRFCGDRCRKRAARRGAVAAGERHGTEPVSSISESA
jgi:hypothetical protein